MKKDPLRKAIERWFPGEAAMQDVRKKFGPNYRECDGAEKYYTEQYNYYKESA